MGVRGEFRPLGENRHAPELDVVILIAPIQTEEEGPEPWEVVRAPSAGDGGVDQPEEQGDESDQKGREALLREEALVLDPPVSPKMFGIGDDPIDHDIVDLGVHPFGEAVIEITDQHPDRPDQQEKDEEDDH